MNTAAVALLVALAMASLAMAGPSDNHEEMMTIIFDCKEKHNPPDEELMGMRSLILPQSHEGKCFMDCVLERMEIIDKDGKFNKKAAEDHAKAKMADQPEELQKHISLIAKCHAEMPTSNDICVIGTNLMSCIKNYAEEFGIELPGADE